MAKSIQKITEIIDNFSRVRGWKNDDPNQLIASVLIEFGELSEHYQWKNKFPEFSEEEKLEIGFEFVDVIFYLFKLASRSGIDIEKCFDLKLPKLEKKFPVGQTTKEHFEVKKEYRRTGKNRKYE